MSLAWLRTLQDEQAAILGPDPWRYGMNDANRRNLVAFLGYCTRQGLAPDGLALNELFCPSSLEGPPSFV